MLLRRRYISEFGRTMLEMISVLLIMGIISVTAMIWWSKAVNTQKANAVLEEVGKRASVIQASNIVDGVEVTRHSGFVTNLYDDEHYKSMSYGFGVSAPQFAADPDGGNKRRVKIEVGAIYKGKEIDQLTGNEKDVYYNSVPEAACKILLERKGNMIENSGGTDYQTGNIVYKWQLQTKDGEPAPDCARQEVMVAWMHKTAAASVAAFSPVVVSTCTSSNDCSKNWECIAGNCVACPPGNIRLAGDPLCHSGCGLVRDGLSDADKDCLTCPSYETFSWKPAGTACGPKSSYKFGQCETQGDGTSKCSSDLCLGFSAVAGNFPCKRCNSVDGSLEMDPLQEGQSCGTNAFCNGGSCVALPCGYESPTQCYSTFVSDGSQCVCEIGYHMLDGCTECRKCEVGSYMDRRSRETKCESCENVLRNSTTVSEGSTSADDCQCRAGFGLNEGACKECEEDYYKDVAGNASCSHCPNNSTTMGAKGATECVCAAGYYKSGNECKACGKGYYKETAGNATACTPCSAANSTTASEASTSASACICKAGYYGNAVTGTCTACAVGTYKASAGNTSCTACSVANSTTTSTGSTSCVCKAGYGGDATTGTCTACAVGTYKASAGNTSCTTCTAANSTTVSTGSTGCVCKPGYSGDAVGNTCTACAKGTYKDTAGNARSCTKCTGTQYQDATGQTSCKTCSLHVQTENNYSVGCGCNSGWNLYNDKCCKCDSGTWSNGSCVVTVSRCSKGSRVEIKGYSTKNDAMSKGPRACCPLPGYSGSCSSPGQNVYSDGGKFNMICKGATSCSYSTTSPRTCE